MTQSQCLRIPLRPESSGELVDFIRGLAERPEELAAVLREEGMIAEAVFLERTPKGEALVLFTKAADLAEAHRVLQSSTHPIQVRMRELAAKAFRAEEASALEVLLDMTGPFEVRTPPSSGESGPHGAA